MRLIQFYKLISITIIISCFTYAIPINPTYSNKEEKVTLITKTKSEGNKKRNYYLIDDNGLMFKYNNFKSAGYKKGDNINLQIMSRTYMASNSNERKKYEYELIINKGKSEIFRRDLIYSKKSSDVVSQKTNKGFYFTQAGYWFEDIILDLETVIKIIPKVKKGHKVYIRLLADKNEKNAVVESRVYPVDYQKKISIKYEDGKKRNDWYIINKDLKQQFMLKENRRYKIYTRSIILDTNIKDEQNNLSQNYSLVAYENGQFLGKYMFEGTPSSKGAYISTDFLSMKNKKLSKSNSFYVSVPNSNDPDKEYAYYTFSSNSDILIKLVEYEK